MADKKLNKRQLLFCAEYIIDLNATASYKRAGYTAKGNAAEVNAHRLLSNTKIQAYIQQLMSKRAKKVEISAEDVLKDILDTRNTCKDNMMIQGENGEYIDNTALNGRNKANELLGKHLKLFTDKVEVESKGELNINFNIPRPKKEK